MNKLRALKSLIQECFSSIVPGKSHQEYEKVETSRGKAIELEDRQEDENAEWSTSESIYQSQNSDREKGNTSLESERKKQMLIGNIDEDLGVKKDTGSYNEEDLFDENMKPTFNQKIRDVGKSVRRTDKKAQSMLHVSKVDKFSMDEELEVEEGWGEREVELV